MGMMDVADFVGQGLGNIEKAMIEVIDLRDRDVSLLSAVPIIGKSALGGFGTSPVAGSLINKGILNDYVGSMLGLNNRKLELNDQYIENLASSKKLFTVQFNPSSLLLSGHSGGMVSKLDYDEETDEATQAPVDTTISLSVDLLFDSMDPQDAFMSDKSNMSPTSLAKGAANIALSATKKKKVTVQRQVEGFIGAIRNENTRLLTFHWGEMSYSGVLRNVAVEYTMFNVTGEPVRAVVGLTIMCADAKIWPNSVAVWQEQYKNSFEKSESFVKGSQTIGNLLNL